MNVTPSNAKPDLTRRDLLAGAVKGLLLTSGALVAGALARFLAFPAEPPRQMRFDLGPAGNYPSAKPVLVADGRAVLVQRAPGEFRALSTTCPHLGCTVEFKDGAFACPCHGSRFDGEGALVRGPATRGLAALRVEIDARGHVILHL